jgi:hypothetical protein
MRKILILATALLLCAVLLLATGCTQPRTEIPVTPTAATPDQTPVAATIVATTIPPTLPSTTPGPTQTLQSVWAVDVQVGSNGEAINPQIIMTFRGGKGMNVIPQINFKVTLSDGVVKEDKMTQPLSVGKTVSLPGTTSNNDRAEIWVCTPDGQNVKIYDAYVPFRSYH